MKEPPVRRNRRLGPQKAVDTASDSDKEGAGAAAGPKSSPATSKQDGPSPSKTQLSSKSSGSGRKVNKHGDVVLKNGVIALRDLELSEIVPPKKHHPEAEKLFGQSLSWGQAYTLFTMVMCGKHLPVEKVRDEELRLRVMYSAHPYAISVEQLSEIEDATAEQRCAYLLGMAKSAQQKLRYNLYGRTNNQFNEKVFTGPGLHPDQLIKVHLGLVGEHADKTFMEM